MSLTETRCEYIIGRIETALKGMREGQRMLVPFTKDDARDLRELLEESKAQTSVSIRLERELHIALKKLEALE